MRVICTLWSIESSLLRVHRKTELYNNYGMLAYSMEKSEYSCIRERSSPFLGSSSNLIMCGIG